MTPELGLGRRSDPSERPAEKPGEEVSWAKAVGIAVDKQTTRINVI
jgi:hypothetical protein